MYTYLLTVAYDGARFAGWQRQPDRDTVQERLEAALRRIFGELVHVYGAGRTDAGVHALRQGAHVCLPRIMEPGTLLRALNGNLPESIAVVAVRAAPLGFHARFHAIGKRYLYRCYVSRVRPVLGAGYTYWLRRPVDLGAMRRGAAALIGEHDFAAFSTNPGYPRPRGTVRTVSHLHLIRRPRGFDLFVQGNGFLYNMVRTIAGTLIDVGQGRIPAEEIAEILVSTDRRRAGHNAPACGLFLQRVLYPAFPAGGRAISAVDQACQGLVN